MRSFRYESFVGTPTPLSADETRRLGPRDLLIGSVGGDPRKACERQPRTRSKGQQRRQRLKDPHRWAKDLPGIAEGLQEPVYIRGVMAGLREAVKIGIEDIPVDQIVATAELVWSEPWCSKPSRYI